METKINKNRIISCILSFIERMMLVAFALAILTIFFIGIYTVINPPIVTVLPNTEFVVLDTYSETVGQRGIIKQKMICEDINGERVNFEVPDNLYVVAGDKISVGSYLNNYAGKWNITAFFSTDDFHWGEITLIKT